MARLVSTAGFSQIIGVDLHSDAAQGWFDRHGGKAVLLGFDALDYWNQSYNRRVVENEVKKLDPAGKRELADQLIAQAEKDDANQPAAAR